MSKKMSKEMFVLEKYFSSKKMSNETSKKMSNETKKTSNETDDVVFMGRLLLAEDRITIIEDSIIEDDIIDNKRIELEEPIHETTREKIEINSAPKSAKAVRHGQFRVRFNTAVENRFSTEAGQMLREIITKKEREIRIRTAAFVALTLEDPSNPSLQPMECSIFESDNIVDELKIGKNFVDHNLICKFFKKKYILNLGYFSKYIFKIPTLFFKKYRF